MKKKRKKEGSTEIKKERKERRKWELSSCVCFSADSRLLVSWNYVFSQQKHIRSFLTSTKLTCMPDSWLLTGYWSTYSLLLTDQLFPIFPVKVSASCPCLTSGFLVVASSGLSALHSLGGVCLCGIWLQHGSCSWSGYSTALLSTSALMCSISNQTTHSHLAFALFESVTQVLNSPPLPHTQPHFPQVLPLLRHLTYSVQSTRQAASLVIV